MDALSFIAELVKALVWPVSVIFIVYLFRHSLQVLLPNIKRLKYKEFEADFVKDLERASQEAKQARLPSEEEAQDIPVGAPEPAAEKYRRLSEVSPRSAVIEAWRDVELALSATAGPYDFDDPQFDKHPNLSNVMDRLTREGKLDPVEKTFLEYLQNLRNRAAHSLNINLRPDQAYHYAMLATQMTAGLKTKKKSDGPVVIKDVPQK